MSENEERKNRIKDYKQRIISDDSQIKNKVQTFQGDLKTSQDNFKTQIKKAKDDNVNLSNELVKSLDRLTNEIQTLKDSTILENKDRITKDLNKLVKTVINEIQKLDSDVGNLVEKQQNDVDTVYSKMSEQAVSGLTDVYSTPLNDILDFKSNINKELGVFKKGLNQTIDDNYTQQEGLVNKISTNYLDSLDEFRSGVKDTLRTGENQVDNLFDESVSDSVSRLEITKTDLSTSIEGSISRMKEVVIQQKDANLEINNQILAEISKVKESTQSKVSDLLSDSQIGVKKIEEDEALALDTLKTSTKDSIEKGMDKNADFQDDLLTKMENTLKAGLYDEIDNLSLSFTKFSDSFLDQIDSLINRLTSTRDEMKATLDELLVDGLKRVGKLGQSFERNLSTIMNDVETNYKSLRSDTVEGLNSAVNNRFGAISNSINGFSSQIDDKLTRFSNGVDTEFTEFFSVSKDSLSSAQKATGEDFDKLVTEISADFNELHSRQSNNVETTLTDVRNSLNAKHSDLVSLIASVDPTLANSVDITREDIKSKTQVFLGESKESFDQFKTRITDLDTNTSSTLNDLAVNTEKAVKKASKENKDEAYALIEGIRTEHRESINTFNSKVVQSFDGSMKKLDSFTEESKEKMNSFYVAQDDILKDILQENRDRTENYNDLRRRLDSRYDEIMDDLETAYDSMKINLNTNFDSFSKYIKQIINTVDNLLNEV